MRQMKLLSLNKEFKAKTSVLEMGMNPGLISIFVKKGISFYFLFQFLNL